MIDRVVFTIGHSTHALGTFVHLLRAQHVTAVADVRSAPYSRYSPAFNREQLKPDLKASNISYVFLGSELGGRPNSDNLYQHGRANYLEMAQTAGFKSGLDRVIEGSNSHRIVLMCTENDPINCHRALLISRVLANLGISVVHIKGNRELESHADFERRLVRAVGLSETLLLDWKETVAEAYGLQSQRAAYARGGGASEKVAAV